MFTLPQKQVNKRALGMQTQKNAPIFEFPFINFSFFFVNMAYTIIYTKST